MKQVVFSGFKSLRKPLQCEVCHKIVDAENILKDNSVSKGDTCTVLKTLDSHSYPIIHHLDTKHTLICNTHTHTQQLVNNLLIS